MERFDYRFDGLPRGWDDQTEYTFKGPVVDGLEHRLVVNIDRALHPDRQTLQGFAAFKTEAILNGYPNSSVKKNGAIRLEGVDAHELVFSWTLAENVERVLQYYFVVVDDRGFTFWCAYTDVSFRSMREDVRSEVIARLPNSGGPEGRSYSV